MGDVKRLKLYHNRHEDVTYPVEDAKGPYVLHPDYADLLTRHNALVEAVSPVAVSWKKKRDMLVRHGEMEPDGECDDVCICVSSMQLDALAALAGEEGK